MADVTWYVTLSKEGAEERNGISFRLHDPNGVLHSIGAGCIGHRVHLESGAVFYFGGSRSSLDTLIYERELHIAWNGESYIMREGSRFMQIKECENQKEFFPHLLRFLGPPRTSPFN